MWTDLSLKYLLLHPIQIIKFKICWTREKLLRWKKKQANYNQVWPSNTFHLFFRITFLLLTTVNYSSPMWIVVNYRSLLRHLIVVCGLWGKPIHKLYVLFVFIIVFSVSSCMWLLINIVFFFFRHFKSIEKLRKGVWFMIKS